MAFSRPWDESKYKRQPQGAYDSRGGQFAPKPDYHDGGKDREKASEIAKRISAKARPIDPEVLRKFAANESKINRALRKIEPMTPEAKTIIAAVDAVIAQSRMPNSVVAYRGMTADFAKAVETLQPGDLLVDQGYRPWFAWRPVRLRGPDEWDRMRERRCPARWVWLRWVWRMRCQPNTFYAL